MSNTTSIGDLIARERNAQQLSQSELAKRAEVGRVYISQLESGQRKDPGLFVVRKLCQALGSGFQIAVSAWLAKPFDEPKRRRKKTEKNTV